MSRSGARPVHWRITAWLVITAMLLPTLAACTTAPYASPSTAAPAASPRADVARLDGIVVDGDRAAKGREPGLVAVMRDGAWQDAYAGFELRSGDRIQTSPRAHAVIRYPSGTEVLMRPNSAGRIGSLTDFVGEVFVKVKGLFSVDTTFVKAGARGTAYLVRTYAGDTASVVVIEGIVDVGSTTGAWPTVPIRAGMMTFAHPRPPQPTPADVDDLVRTRDWVERVERLTPAPAGMSTSAIVGAIVIGAAIAAILSNRNKGSSDHGEQVPPSTTRSPSTRETLPPPAPSTRETRPPPAVIPPR